MKENDFLTLKRNMLDRFHLTKTQGSLFFIFKVLMNQLSDAKILSEYIIHSPIINKDENFDILKLLNDCKIFEINELSPLLLENIKHIFVVNCSFYLNESFKDDSLFPLFIKIMESFKDFNYDLFSLKFDVFMRVLKEKKYEILKFLIEKKNIHLLLNDEKEINNFLSQNSYNEINKSLTFKKSLQNNMTINIKLVILFYLSEISDNYIIKLFFL